MNKKNLIIIFLIYPLICLEIFWDLGVGISNFQPSHLNQEISSSTYHRLEGMKKYYDMDYHAAIFHFESMERNGLASTLYHYIDCLYLTEQYTKALAEIASNSLDSLTDNIIYLQSKIYYKLGLYDEALKCLNYITNNFTNSEYNEIIIFDIEKLNLLNND